MLVVCNLMMGLLYAFPFAVSGHRILTLYELGGSIRLPYYLFAVLTAFF